MPTPAGKARLEAFALGPFGTNCYVVHAPPDPACWIVDAGYGPAPMIERIREAGLRPERILLTHAHVDHIGGLTEVRRAFPGVPTAIHPAERDWLGDPTLNLSAAMGDPFTAAPAEESLEEGQTLTLAGAEARVLHTPGHSPGGVTLVLDGSEAALVGDTLFAGSIGRFDFPTSDQDRLFASIRDKLYALPDAFTAHPGHGPPTTIGREKRSNPFVRAAETPGGSGDG
jgi:hydroxyacylglutathione hydrolase